MREIPNTMTTAYAQKIIRQLEDEKNKLNSDETERCSYIVAAGEEPVVPEYSYETTSRLIEEIDQKIATIKHAINVANSTHTITINNKHHCTIDYVLIHMAQLNNRKTKLEYMRKIQKQARVNNSYVKNLVEYKYANFEHEDVERDYKNIVDEITDLQLALDQYNQTVMINIV